MERQRFGEVALDLGLLTPEQLTDVVQIQHDEDVAGSPRRPLGLICMQRGYLSFEQVVAVLARQQQSPIQA